MPLLKDVTQAILDNLVAQRDDAIERIKNRDDAAKVLADAAAKALADQKAASDAQLATLQTSYNTTVANNQKMIDALGGSAAGQALILKKRRDDLIKMMAAADAEKAAAAAELAKIPA